MIFLLIHLANLLWWFFLTFHALVLFRTSLLLISQIFSNKCFLFSGLVHQLAVRDFGKPTLSYRPLLCCADSSIGISTWHSGVSMAFQRCSLHFAFLVILVFFGFVFAFAFEIFSSFMKGDSFLLASYFQLFMFSYLIPNPTKKSFNFKMENVTISHRSPYYCYDWRYLLTLSWILSSSLCLSLESLYHSWQEFSHNSPSQIIRMSLKYLNNFFFKKMFFRTKYKRFTPTRSCMIWGSHQLPTANFHSFSTLSGLRASPCSLHTPFPLPVEEHSAHVL